MCGVGRAVVILVMIFRPLLPHEHQLEDTVVSDGGNVWSQARIPQSFPTLLCLCLLGWMFRVIKIFLLINILLSHFSPDISVR